MSHRLVVVGCHTSLDLITAIAGYLIPGQIYLGSGHHGRDSKNRRIGRRGFALGGAVDSGWRNRFGTVRLDFVAIFGLQRETGMGIGDGVAGQPRCSRDLGISTIDSGGTDFDSIVGFARLRIPVKRQGSGTRRRDGQGRRGEVRPGMQNVAESG